MMILLFHLICQKPTDKIPLENKHIYSIPRGDWKEKYIGETNGRIFNFKNIKTEQTSSSLFMQHQYGT